ncbi:MAG TPA: extracellular solute-binding protein [Patescibacteria group bacterium]|nr:extracellular solute-binding protein [Patescibacteria group bacterium]
MGTQSAAGNAPLSPSVTPVKSGAPTPTTQLAISANNTNSAGSDFVNGRLTLWVNETSEDHAVALEEMVAQFSAKQHIQVEVLLVSPQLLPQLVQQAVISGTLPDLIIHPVTYSAGWAEKGILDPGLATEALRNIGESTFDQEALNAVHTENDLIFAIPTDGWRQLLIYRSDWFAERNLEPPDNYISLMAAAEALDEPEGSTSGIVVPTDASLVSTQQVFEYLAIANDCRLVEPGGRVTVLHPYCLEALEFYRALINQFSPIGFQTDISSLNAYLAGRTGMIVTSPAALPFIAGLVDQNIPGCPECVEPGYLAKNSGYITRLYGGAASEKPSGFSELTALGFTPGANRDGAVSFADFWFNEGYSTWLAVNPERKVPLRSGTQDQPRLFVDAWASNQLSPAGPTLEEVFGADLVHQLIEDIAGSNRWGIAEDEGILTSTLYQDLLISPLLQDMLSGYFTSSQTIIELYQVVVNAIPHYNFPIEIVSTPEP